MSGLGVALFAPFFDNGMQPSTGSSLPDLEDVEFFLTLGRERSDAVLRVSELVKQSVTSMVQRAAERAN